MGDKERSNGMGATMNDADIASVESELRIRALEKKVKRLTECYERLYNTTYARLTRRKSNEARAIKSAKKLASAFDRVDDDSVRRIVRVINSVEKGRHLITLDDQQFHRLTYILRPQVPGRRSNA